MKAVHTLNPILERRQRWTEDEIEFSGSMSFVACSCGWYRWVKPDRDARLEGLYGATEAEDAWIAHIEGEEESATTRTIACGSTG